MVTKRIPLSQMYLGSIDGKKEAQDPVFLDLFYTGNNKYSELCYDGKFIITGKKGSGKTILAHYLHTNKNKQHNCISLILNAPDIYNLKRLREIGDLDPEKTELQLFWKWIFLVEIGKVILRLKRMCKYNPFSSLNKIHNYIEYLESDINIHFFETHKDVSTKKSVNSSENIGLGHSILKLWNTGRTKIKSNESYINNERKKYFDYLDKLQIHIEKVLAHSKEEITLIFDDLDEKDQICSDHDFYLNILKNMITVANTLNDSLLNQTEKKSKIIIVLRDDIMRFLHKKFTNTNKIEDVGGVQLEWFNGDRVHQYEHPLIEMILNKVKKSVKEYAHLKNSELFRIIFPNSIDKRKTVNYLLEYSLGRPRDIIKYLNLIKKDHGSSTYFSPKAFNNCRKKYSKYFYTEIVNEISSYDNSTELNECLKLIEYQCRRHFEFTEIELLYNSNKNEYPKIVNLKECLKSLYEIGVIGNTWLANPNEVNKGKPKIFNYSWYYRPDGRDQLDCTKTIILHKGLWRTFSM